jgi:transposase
MDDALLLDPPDDLALLKQMVLERGVYIQRITQEAAAERDAAIAARAAQIEQLTRQAAGEIARRDAVIVQRDAAIEQIKREATEQLEAERQRHKAEMDAVLRRFYGPHSERFDPTQLLLFGQMVDSMPIDEKAVEQEAGERLGRRRSGKRHNHGRGVLPAHLDRVPVIHDLPEARKFDVNGKPLVRIGCTITEQLEFKRAGLFVLEHHQFKYARADYQQSDAGADIVIAEKPAQPIQKGLPGPGLLAHVVVSKLADHLPLYRLEGIFKRQNVHIARSTMCGWMDAISQVVKPLVDRMIGRVKGGEVIHTDDTRVPVQDGKIKGKCKSGRIWCVLGDRSNPYDIYVYTADRSRAGPQEFLGTFKGYLQADAYGGYDGIYASGVVVEVACWAHARRKFFDARTTDGRRSAEMLALVGELYAVEREAADAIAKVSSPTAQQQDQIRYDLRQSRSVAILGRIKSWLDAESKLVLPRSEMAKAINYALNQWSALCRYVDKGFLNIDNNAAERALKRVAIGRKNWLFSGNDHFAEVSARLSTLIASAQRHGLDPEAYLTSVFAKIGQTPLSELDQFLPDVWKADDAAEGLTARGPELPPIS